MTDRYAVVGNPVAHSLSPQIHEAFAVATGQALVYERLPAPVNGFAATVERFFAAGGAGLNVTVPFKEEAAGWVDELDQAATAAGAVNTICRVDGQFRGCNTDGAGLVRDLTANLHIDLTGAHVLLLGAGGAARGVTAPLLAAGVSRLVIANRTESRARALADAARRVAQDARRAAPAAEVRASSLAAVTPGFDLVLNATSAGLAAGAAAVPEVDPECARDAFCYDMMYARGGEAATAFCRWALDHGAAGCADGLGMLVEQAALAFALWRGVTPATAPVLELLRRESV